MNLSTYIRDNLDFDHITVNGTTVVVLTHFLNQKYFSSVEMDLSSGFNSSNLKKLSEAEKIIVDQIKADLLESMDKVEEATVIDNLSGNKKTIIVRKLETGPEPDSIGKILDTIDNTFGSFDDDLIFGMSIL